jgi:hypothetical protein
LQAAEIDASIIGRKESRGLAVVGAGGCDLVVEPLLILREKVNGFTSELDGALIAAGEDEERGEEKY